MSKINKIIETLKAARVAKGWSQRTLSQKVGIPQSHISKIESGAVDLKTSNLMEMARTLDMEVMLVPRTMIITIRSLLSQETIKDTPPPAYRINEKSNED